MFKSMSPKKRSLVNYLIKGFVTLILVGLIIWYLGGMSEVGSLMIKISPLYIVIIMALETFDRGLMTFKWGWLLRGRGIHLPLFSGMKIYCSSMIWGMFLPATVGADAIRAYSSSKAGIDSKEVVASILVERLIGFLSATVLGLLGLILLSGVPAIHERFFTIWLLGLGLLILTMGGFIASLMRGPFDFVYRLIPSRFQESGVIAKIKRFHSVYLAYQDHKKELFVFFALTFAEQLLRVVHVWLIGRGIGLEIGLLFLAGVVPFTILISRIPISINGIGVYDGSFMFLLSLAGIPPAGAIAITLNSRIIQAAAWFPWWIMHFIEAGGIHPNTSVLRKELEKEASFAKEQ
jgi:uncharacterized protein (TIRG00374 family)